MELKDKVAIVTGAGRGIGEGIARVLSREGAAVVIMDRTAGDANKVADSIMKEGGRAMSCAADVTKADSLNAMVLETLKHFGSIDILVNNAGIESTPKLLKDLPEEQWDKVMAVNLKGVFLCSKAVIPTMMAKGKGRIINISSTAGIRMTFFGSAEYTASKHGVAGLAQHLAWELADHHITVNTVCPGGVMTPLMELGSTPEFREAAIRRLVPLGRFCTIDEIGQAVSFLASDRADMITGQELAVDGGLLTGFGEDLRNMVRKRMEQTQAEHAHR